MNKWVSKAYWLISVVSVGAGVHFGLDGNVWASMFAVLFAYTVYELRHRDYQQALTDSALVAILERWQAKYGMDDLIKTLEQWRDTAVK